VILLVAEAWLATVIGPAAPAVEANRRSAAIAEITSIFIGSFRTVGREGRVPLYTRTRAEMEIALPPPREV
jgi:hypothetical protein